LCFTLVTSEKRTETPILRVAEAARAEFNKAVGQLNRSALKTSPEGNAGRKLAEVKSKATFDTKLGGYSSTGQNKHRRIEHTGSQGRRRTEYQPPITVDAC